MAALNKLPEERRQVFIDAAIDGKSYQQVADEQGIKIGTVMSRLNRARNQLKQELADAAIDGKSYQQVADEQGIKIGTVMSRLSRARNQLKQELAEYAAARGYGKTARGNKTTGKSVESHSDRELVGASGKKRRVEIKPPANPLNLIVTVNWSVLRERRRNEHATAWVPGRRHGYRKRRDDHCKP